MRPPHPVDAPDTMPAGAAFVPAPAKGLAPTLTLLGALVLLLAYPKPDWTALAWVAPALWFVRLLRPPRRRLALSGLGFGLVFFGGLLYWTVPALRLHGGLSLPASLAAYALLVLYLSLFPALFAVGIGRIAAVHRGLAVGVLPVYWVALEWIRAHLFTGFPWGLLGYTQYRNPAWIQIAACTGVYGVSFLVAGVNALLAGAVVSTGRGRIVWLAAAAAVLIAVPSAGVLVLPPVESGPVRIGVVQGNIRQDRKWEPTDGETILQHYSDLTRQAIEAGARLVVWPEAALPYPLSPAGAAARDPAAMGSTSLRRRLELLVRDSPTGLLVGAVEYRSRDGGRAAFNGAQYYSADTGWGKPYDKVQLVPFVEYIPLPRLFFFLKRLAGGTIADFLPGEGVVLHRVGGSDFATAICYEMIFPHRIRDYTRAGARWLVNITNDGWFGESAGPYQHFAMSVFRAVENRRWVIRAANTGISGFIDPYGRIVRTAGLHERQVVVEDVRPRDDATVYHRAGDLFAAACGIMTLGTLLVAGRRAGGR